MLEVVSVLKGAVYHVNSTCEPSNIWRLKSTPICSLRGACPSWQGPLHANVDCCGSFVESFQPAQLSTLSLVRKRTSLRPRRPGHYVDAGMAICKVQARQSAQPMSVPRPIEGSFLQTSSLCRSALRGVFRSWSTGLGLAGSRVCATRPGTYRDLGRNERLYPLARSSKRATGNLFRSV